MRATSTMAKHNGTEARRTDAGPERGGIDAKEREATGPRGWGGPQGLSLPVDYFHKVTSPFRPPSEPAHVPPFPSTVHIFDGKSPTDVVTQLQEVALQGPWCCCRHPSNLASHDTKKELPVLRFLLPSLFLLLFPSHRTRPSRSTKVHCPTSIVPLILIFLSSRPHSCSLTHAVHPVLVVCRDAYSQTLASSNRSSSRAWNHDLENGAQ